MVTGQVRQITESIEGISEQRRINNVIYSIACFLYCVCIQSNRKDRSFMSVGLLKSYYD